MSNDLVSLVLDVVILGFLVATIFYVIRLTKGLSDFKAHRREFNGVITSLLSSIDKAERSVHSLKQVSVQEAAELERLIKQSKLMYEDLKIINEAGESMAKRLEKLAERNREVAQKSRHPIMGEVMGGIDEQKISSKVPLKSKSRTTKKDYKSTLKTVDKHISESDTGDDLPSFMIQDREFTDFSSLEDHLDASTSNDAWDDDNDMPANLQSRSEQELFAALRKNERNSSNKRGSS